MNIFECEFKGTQAVRLENDQVIIIVLPEVGGKIASFYNKNKQFELLFQNKKSIYKKANVNDDFSQYDASGFDDCFPSIVAEKVFYGKNEIEYPDHGEIWSSSFKYDITEDTLIMWCESKILPYRYNKVISIKGYNLTINYNIINNGNKIIECLWAMHCLINCKEDMLINFPSKTAKVINVLQSEALGEIGEVHSFPITKTKNGTAYELNKVCSRAANKFEKYYIVDKVAKGYCEVVYPSDKINFEIKYDSELLPYLGFWVTEGGFRGDYNCALEPTNGFYDSVNIAKKNNKLLILKPKENFDFSITLTLK